MNRTFTKISIITPVYNRVQYIEATINSVLSQDYPELEYIIIDGGSTDGTVDIIKKYDSQLAYWVSEPDYGMYHAIQKGFEKATGDIMAWLNSDDMYHNKALFIVSDIFGSLPDVNWLTGIPSFYNTNGICVKTGDLPYWSKERFATGDYRWIQQESTFWRRSLWELSGAHLNLDYKFAGDFELWCRFFQQTELYAVNTVLSGFRLHGKQLSVNSESTYNEETEQIYKSYFLVKKRRYSFFYCMKKHIKVKIVRNLFYLLMEKRYKKWSHIIFFEFKKNKWSYK